MGLEANLESRRRLLAALRSEVIGPEPGSQRFDSLPSRLSRDEERKLPPVSQPDGEEILTRDAPTFRYGAGVLHPPELPAVEEEDEDLAGTGGERVEEEAPGAFSEGQKRARGKAFEAEGDDLSLSATNSFKPSAMGFSLVVDLDRLEAGLVIELVSGARYGRDSVEFLDCGYYRSHKVEIEANEKISKVEQRQWWLRRPLRTVDGRPRLELSPEDLQRSGKRRIVGTGFPGDLDIRWTVRSWPGAPTKAHRLLTISLQNLGCADGAGNHDEYSLFQAGLMVQLPHSALSRYPSALLPVDTKLDPLDDERVNRLLYSNRPVYAVGHGCATDWMELPTGNGWRLWTDVMPAYEMSPMAFEVMAADGQHVRLSMRSLASIDREAKPVIATLRQLVVLYENWIDRLPAGHVEDVHKETAGELVGRCQMSAKRMHAGINILEEDGHACRAFALANEAMLMAQHRRPSEARKPQFSPDGEASWPTPYHPLDIEDASLKASEDDQNRPVAQWRPFQLAFLLMSLEGIVCDHTEDRQTVDLIWFPTGGGKTEAYLGLAAFTVFYNALSGRVSKQANQPRAVSILMRYTLRLLTAQQFQRAVILFSAMELLRICNADLGNQRFTVGLWVGGTSTPNDMIKAQRAKKLMDGSVSPQPEEDADANPFVLLQCPWCNAAFGRQRQSGRGNRRTEYEIHGYSIAGKGQDVRFVYRCPDRNCEFGPGKDAFIPALVVDEMLYQNPPSLLIGTVDKFAMLAWKPEARSLFGIGNDGERIARGPELIIQDELHLMTGPLGTMVGLFETAVDSLCRYQSGVPAKIIASTATAARAGDQIRALYAAKTMRVFPPPGLDAADSFFAKEANDKPGRLYVGILAPGHGSMQTTQRHIYAALLQGAADIATGSDEQAAPDLADPWWTLLAYYNSLRELGGALTLFGADIPDQLDVIALRRGLTPQSKRRVRVDGNVMELTSRISSADVPEALRSMEKSLDVFAKDKGGQRTVWANFAVQDACLASNIIEVGVDVPRLSLMAIVGQPKTTSAYIQASSRVGRRDDRPGLVAMLYSNTKPRDRSHYERFRAYHQSIYSWVEATSVTPFSPPAVARALHAVLVAMTRQTGSLDQTPQVAIADTEKMDRLRDLLEERAGVVARKDEVAGVTDRFGQLLREWTAYNPDRWGRAKENGVPPPSLLYASGSERPPTWGHTGWATPTSLRAVDATCEAQVTQHYADMQAAREEI